MGNWQRKKTPLLFRDRWMAFDTRSDSDQRICLLFPVLADHSLGSPKLCSGPPSAHGKGSCQSNHSTKQKQPRIGCHSRSAQNRSGSREEFADEAAAVSVVHMND